MELRPPCPIVTERLRLRPLTGEDATALLSYRGQPEVCRYLPFDPMDARVLAERLAGDLGRRAITAEGQGVTLGVELTASGRLVGDVVLFLTSRLQALGEIGYVFHPGVAGHGYATEACSAVLDWAFAQDGAGLHRVVARLDARNSSSARLATRLGLHRVARTGEVHHGERTDLLVYAVRDEEWRARRSEHPGGGTGG